MEQYILVFSSNMRERGGVGVKNDKFQSTLLNYCIIHLAKHSFLEGPMYKRNLEVANTAMRAKINSFTIAYLMIGTTGLH